MRTFEFGASSVAWGFLNARQRREFLHVKDHLDCEETTDLKCETSYLTLYIDEYLSLLLDFGLDAVEDVIRKFLFLKATYGGREFLQRQLDSHIGDSLCLKGDFVKALDYYVLDVKETSTHPANHVMNLKYELGINVAARELLCTVRKLTKFGGDHVVSVEQQFDSLLKEDRLRRGVDYLRYVAESHVDRRRYGMGLFNGYGGGSELNALFERQPYSFRKYCFYSIEELLAFTRTLSREAENLVRREHGLPNVGEGWLSETQLYNQVKSYLRDFRVLNHYSPAWLGRQHLDIFVPELGLAFEFQGKQHFEPVGFFGGTAAFRDLRKRDRTKKAKCTRNGVCLISVTEGYGWEDVQRVLDERIASVASGHAEAVHVSDSEKPRQGGGAIDGSPQSDATRLAPEVGGEAKKVELGLSEQAQDETRG
jgi:hypothetical protein